MITGHTRPFRNRVDAFGIARGYAENGDGDARRYYRVWKQIEVAGEGSLLGHAGHGVQKRGAPRYHGCHARSGHVAAFIEKLRAVPSLFFAP